jgi:hypothetical protein
MVINIENAKILKKIQLEQTILWNDLNVDTSG